MRECKGHNYSATFKERTIITRIMNSNESEHTTELPLLNKRKWHIFLRKIYLLGCNTVLLTYAKLGYNTYIFTYLVKSHLFFLR